MGRKSRGQNSRGKRRGSGKEEEDSDFEVDDNHDGNFDDPQQQQQTSKNPPSSKDKHLDFAQRRELQRKEAAEKRRSKMKCYLCNQTGHVRRECPGIQDDGRGMSRYKNKSDVKASQFKHQNSKKKKQHGLSTSGEDGPTHADSILDHYPEGFVVSQQLRQDKLSRSERSSGSDGDEDDEIEENVGTNQTSYYYDTGCDINQTIDYLRSGRGKHKISMKEALEEYEHSLRIVVTSDENESSDDNGSKKWNLGGVISKTQLENLHRPWIDSSPPFLSSSGRTEQSSSMVRILCYTLGLSPKFLVESKKKDDDKEENDESVVLQSLIDTVEKNSSTTQDDDGDSVSNHHPIIGFWSSLDYTPNRVKDKGYDQNSQLNRLRCCCQAAGETNLPIQIQLLPGAASLSRTSTTDGGGGGGSDTWNVKGTDYAKVLLDFQGIVDEMLQIYPNLIIVLSCWTGLADHMMSLLKAFPSQNLWISFDGSVSFQKATYLHECAFEIPLERLLLETSTVIPSCVANVLGRDASFHSGYWPFVVQAIANYKSVTGKSIDDVTKIVAENAIKCYPKLKTRD